MIANFRGMPSAGTELSDATRMKFACAAFSMERVEHDGNGSADWSDYGDGSKHDRGSLLEKTAAADRIMIAAATLMVRS